MLVLPTKHLKIKWAIAYRASLSFAVKAAISNEIGTKNVVLGEMPCIQGLTITQFMKGFTWRRSKIISPNFPPKDNGNGMVSYFILLIFE